MTNTERLLLEYKLRKKEIKKRLREFKCNLNATDKHIFAELCFCLLTPQSKALACDKAIKNLKKNNCLYSGCWPLLKNSLKGNVRFHNNKARYIIEARKKFLTNQKKSGLKNIIDRNDIMKTRNLLVKNIKGIGYKEAGHFLRNIGLGRDIAILDRHILSNLKMLGVIKNAPRSLNTKTYLAVEGKMRKFSDKIGIPMPELDLLLWAMKTGYVFK